MVLEKTLLFSFIVSEVQLSLYNFSQLFWSEPRGRKVAMWSWIGTEGHMRYKDAAVALRVAGIVHSMTLSYCSYHTEGYSIICALMHRMLLLS